MKRQVLLVVNPTREEARSGALSLAKQLQAREIAVFQALSTEGEQIAGIPVRESSADINDFEYSSVATSTVTSRFKVWQS